MTTYSGFITYLQENEVFVFGSNLSGFHGAGAAGYASFGEPGNVWRKHDYGSKPDGWRGVWNIKGCAEGLQEGELGKSYALPTVSRPKVPLNPERIKDGIRNLYDCANEHPGLRFFIAYRAKGRNLNGYSSREMASFFASSDIPGNVIFEREFFELVKSCIDARKNSLEEA